jgi:hypothetical protein
MSVREVVTNKLKTRNHVLCIATTFRSTRLKWAQIPIYFLSQMLMNSTWGQDTFNHLFFENTGQNLQVLQFSALKARYTAPHWPSP